jgi:hypothetical protein
MSTKDIGEFVCSERAGENVVRPQTHPMRGVAGSVDHQDGDACTVGDINQIAVDAGLRSVEDYRGVKPSRREPRAQLFG